VKESSSVKKDSLTKSNTQSKGVKTLLGDPKKAIIKLAMPMIIAMSATTIYNLVDALWVSGLGPDALAAVGFVFPFLFMVLAIANGLGIGGGAAISRKIGADDKKKVDKIAVHTLVIMTLIAMIFTLSVFIFASDIFLLIGAGNIAPLAANYARILAIGTMTIFFTYIALAILRAEGDAKRSMFAILLGAGLNIILDPIFIYTFGLGVAGAAWATVLSMSITSVLLFYWLFLKRDTYVSIHFRGFRFSKQIIIDILKVGLPAMIMQLSMSIMMLIMNLIVNSIGGTDGVAVFTAGWRIVTIATLPLIGIATAVVSVTGAAYGSHEFEKLKTSHMYAVKIGIIIEVILATATFLLAPLIAKAFTLAEESARIYDDLTNFLQIICIFYPGVALGMLSSSMFQGIGKGFYALLVTIFRSIILTTPLALIFSTILGLGLSGAWWGIVTANITGSTIAFIWAKIHIGKLLHSKSIQKQ
jgi:putative MATE family efflux protein